MKKGYWVLGGGVAVLLTLAIGLTGSSDVQKESSESPLASVVSVSIPDSVVFGGETLVLDRYDKRERFDREINAFAYLHSSTMLLIKRANRFFPIIEPILAKHNVPDDFKYLAVIESSLNVRALSPVKAAGLWQFMPATAKEFGLEVSAQVDERYHVEKSTEAACRYLLKAYRELGSWANAAAAYNAGSSRIRTELSRQQVDSFFDLLLVDETSRYVYRLFAIKAIFAQPSRYGFRLKQADLYPPIRTKEVEVSGDVADFAFFAKEHGINYMILKDFNVWLRDRELQPKGRTYSIRIPVQEDMFCKPKDVRVHEPAWLFKGNF